MPVIKIDIDPKRYALIEKHAAKMRSHIKGVCEVAVEAFVDSGFSLESAKPAARQSVSDRRVSGWQELVEEAKAAPWPEADKAAYAADPGFHQTHPDWLAVLADQRWLALPKARRREFYLTWIMAKTQQQPIDYEGLDACQSYEALRRHPDWTRLNQDEKADYDALHEK